MRVSHCSRKFIIAHDDRSWYTFAIMKRRDFLLGTTVSALGLGMRRMHASDAPDHGSVCPKCPPPARSLATFDLRELTTDIPDFVLTLCCLQGIVNRRQPRLYLIQDEYDELWLDWLRERGDIDKVEKLGIGHVVARFIPEVGSMCITDPEIPASVNVATMLAGINSALVSTPAISGQFSPLSVSHDLRRMQWKKDVDAYRWFFPRYDTQLSRQAVAILDPVQAVLRDYLVAFKIPTVWISAPGDAARNPQADFDSEKSFARDLFLRWPANIPCFGWPGNGTGSERGIGEGEGVRLLSQCAKFEVCSGYDGNSPTVSNMTVHSGTKATLKQTTPPAHLESDKVYFSLCRSDGDGPNFLRHYYRKLFDDPSHGEVPIGWQIGPTAFDTMPDILDFYYRHARPGDCFMNALTGVGYIHEAFYADAYPKTQQDKILQKYVSLSGTYRARIDATTLCTLAEMSPMRLKCLASIPGIRGVFANYGRSPETTPDNLLTIVDGKPVFRAVNKMPAANMSPEKHPFTLPRRTEAVAETVRSIQANTPTQRPCFLNVFLGNWVVRMNLAEEIARSLGPSYVPVRPDQLVSLFEQSRGRDAR